MEKVDYQEAMDRMVEVYLVKMMETRRMVNQQIHVWMRQHQHLSVIMESVPVLWDGSYRVEGALVS